MYKKPVILFLGILLFNLFSYNVFGQVAISPDPVLITQPNNSKLTIIGAGTENNSYTETIDGYTLLKNKKGIYVYAKLDNNQRLTPSKLKAHNPECRSKKETKCLKKNYMPHLR